MALWHIWIIVGIGFFIWEIFTPGFVVAVVGLGCLAGGLAAFLEAGYTGQVAAFAAMVLVGFVVIRPFFVRWLYPRRADTQSGIVRLIGRRALVVEAIDPHSGAGRVKLGGETWRALPSIGEMVIPLDAEVEVQGVEGITLKVAPVKESAAP